MSNFKKVNTRGSVTKSHAFIVQKINIINDKFEAMPGIAARKISTLLTKTCIENYIREEKFLGNKIPRVPHKIPFEGAINYDDTYDTSLDPSLLLTPKKTKSLAEQYTPVSTKASQIRDQSEAAHMQYDPERGMNLVSYTTIIANHLINSPAVKERVAMQTSLKTLTTSHPLDYIAINIIKNSGSLTHQTCGKIFTSIIYTQEHSAENIQTKTYEKTYNQTKTKASLVLGIGSYTKIAQTAQWIMKKGNIDDTVLASYLKAASNGFKLEVTGLTHKQIAFIIHLNALLFGEEAHRHTSSYLINHMFIDLIEDGIFTFKDLPSKLPMAITKAVMASRTLDHHLFKAIKTHTPYDTSTKMHDINAKEVKELMSRSYNVISETKWSKCYRYTASRAWGRSAR